MATQRVEHQRVEPWYQICTKLAVPPVRLWFKFRVAGLERIPASGPAIIACNHISYLDPFSNGCAVIDAGRRPRFLAKQELFHVFLVGRALRGAGQIPVSRGTKDVTPLLKAKEALERGESIVIYPEGTVTKRADHLPMEGKTGAARLSLMSGVPITPMASWGSQTVWQKSGPGSLKYGRPVLTTVGEPMDVNLRASEIDEREAVKEMTAELMSRLTDMVIDLRARYPRSWS
ncbi:MAG: lysophospholipid acyltransferase family protein [Actinomycetota bacterium]